MAQRASWDFFRRSHVGSPGQVGNLTPTQDDGDEVGVPLAERSEGRCFLRGGNQANTGLNDV